MLNAMDNHTFSKFVAHLYAGAFPTTTGKTITARQAAEIRTVLDERITRLNQYYASVIAPRIASAEATA